MASKRTWWVWNWVGGGYNSCSAETKAEAMEKAEAMTNNSTLRIVKGSLRQVTFEELDAIDRQYASLFY